MEIRGTIKKVGEIQTFPSGFQKRELIIVTHEQYPQPISIEFLSDKVDLLDKFQYGQNVKVGINIRGREWASPQGETKYFNSIVGWSIYDLNQTEPTQPKPATEPAPQKDAFSEFEEDEDDLPF